MPISTPRSLGAVLVLLPVLALAVALLPSRPAQAAVSSGTKSPVKIFSIVHGADGCHIGGSIQVEVEATPGTHTGTVSWALWAFDSGKKHKLEFDADLYTAGGTLLVHEPGKVVVLTTTAIPWPSPTATSFKTTLTDASDVQLATTVTCSVANAKRRVSRVKPQQ